MINARSGPAIVSRVLQPLQRHDVVAMTLIDLTLPPVKTRCVSRSKTLLTLAAVQRPQPNTQNTWRTSLSHLSAS